MAQVIAINFKEGGKVYYFAAPKDRIESGAGVIVETARGIEYGKVVTPNFEVDDEKIVSPLKPVLRRATKKDEETHLKNLERRSGAMQTTREQIEKHGLDMKLIDCEFAFDGSKAVFYYSAPQRVDFRELVKDLSSIFRMRIELRQIGIRDEIKMLGGLAFCGRECCCSSYMTDLNKVSIKMAKNQGLSLNPTKISGLCGRLMCCLAYEDDYYADAIKRMPKIGASVVTPDGDGTVVNINMIKMQVRVKIEDKSKDLITYKDYPVEELEAGAPKTNKKRRDEEELPAPAEEEREITEIYEKTDAQSGKLIEKPEGRRRDRRQRRKGQGGGQNNGKDRQPSQNKQPAEKPLKASNGENNGNKAQGEKKFEVRYKRGSRKKKGNKQPAKPEQ